MRYYSIHQPEKKVGFSQAVEDSLAPDGSLYVPEVLPKHLVSWQENYAQFAYDLLQGFLVDDPLLHSYLPICEQAFNFPVVLKKMSQQLSFLELFHGPTASFKDFGARHLAQISRCMSHDKERLIMVATSGDTGSAVAAAFHQVPHVRVVIMYPHQMVSKRQAHQLACWGDNILTLAVEGDFDDCQRLLKTALNKHRHDERFALTTANSINIGRLLPQVAYFAYASLLHTQGGHDRMHVIVPSGNVGNATAAYWAREMGYPLGDIVLAQNENHTVVDYLQAGKYEKRATRSTIANAMDVGDPSNFARLRHLYPDFATFQSKVKADWLTDVQIKAAIQDAYMQTQAPICPHTAAAYGLLQKLDRKHWVVVATAHPAKFESVVEPLLDTHVPLPAMMKQQLSRPEVFLKIPATMSALMGVVDQWLMGVVEN